MNLGEVLAAARASSRLSLDELAAITSIRAGLLSEMEKNNFSQCGGDIYARGHLRNIAPKIGLDPNQLVDLYNQEHSMESRSINEMLIENNVTRVPQEKKNLSWKVPAAFSIALVLVLGIVQIIISNVSSEPAPSVSASASPSATSSPTPSGSEAASAPAVGEGVEMSITAARGSSLIDIVINGEHVFKGSLFQGESKTFSSDTSISVYFSNPAGLDVIVNGETLPPLAGQNEEVRRTFR
jgi:cytoskeletal protein RodZ